MLDDTQVRERVGRLDGLLQEVESLADTHAREVAVTAVQSLLELYGEGLARVVQRLGPQAQSLVQDELVEHLLLVHGLHPVDLETRVRDALASLPRAVAGVELLNVQDGTARVRAPGLCGSEKALIEQAVQQAAPDLEAVEFETRPSSSFVALDSLARR